MQPTETLIQEHRYIWRMLAVARSASDRIDRGEEVPTEALERIVDFIRNFADAYHHAKEDNLLFVRAVERGLPSGGGPIAVMRMEHEESRGYTRKMAEALERFGSGDDRAHKAFTAGARNYADLLTRHIDKEDQILYPMIDGFLTPEDQKELTEQFEEVARSHAGAGEPERFHRAVEELESLLGVG